ncbi:4-hydroxy-tetrahydrodipicolinate synthase [Hymenobacter taeanensis]|uniref:4-hydroxy-tetrahydrodipicolinate synthase n=1 Tax=Hymenobacter taeanensis TaxID=2735321 RepID=A0A6M6BM29_9BACT|nr:MULTISPECIES: 4-hydroxy-tetrahydrodipicolinate synthase [Hymenobacter]QJX48493.1 4-hydroxy-tetrahydrodipicolinate synthase [Hymenobacter taeanensis]UOQ82010.1 4-hydroxy-tetrahydrodipicolinate synthase [Hymenobacter sp. 5414T-23]
MDKLRGTGVALVTPFTPTPDCAVDYDALRRLVDFTLEGGVEYLVINGTTAESPTLTTEEKAEILRVVRAQVNGRVPLVYGIGGNDTAAVVRTIQNTDLSGITALLSASPHYNKPSQRGIIAHYERIADASPVPVLLYNVPGRTSSNLTAATTLLLAQHANIIGIKEASGNLEQCIAIAAAKPEDFLLISGDDMMTTSLISFGAVGIISVLANAFPRRFSDMTRHALTGDYKAASQLLFGFVELNPLMYEESNPVGVKAALESLGVCSGSVRLPLVDASEGLRTRIQKLI